MATKSDFSADEWSAICNAPHIAALAVAAVGSSGQLGAAVRALNAKVPVDAAAYVAWVAGIATKVSEAASEGGFLGFGAERVSAAETAMIDKLKSAMSAA